MFFHINIILSMQIFFLIVNSDDEHTHKFCIFNYKLCTLKRINVHIFFFFFYIKTIFKILSDRHQKTITKYMNYMCVY